MIQHNGKRLCSSCFAELQENQTACSACGFSDSDEARYPIALPMGTILLGKYVIGRLLGKGGFGITYLAFDMKEGKTVAVKEYLPDSLIHRNTGDTLVSTYYGDKEEAFKAGAEKFYEEAKTIARFNSHPNIIHVSEFFYENNTAYFVMEYINGSDLKTYIAQKGCKLTERETLNILASLMDALASVHSVGVLHRDISPDNIFVTSDGVIKLLDFGSARQVLGEQSKSLSVILKPGFAPIEQYQTRGKQGEWTDIYALAATMYYCLTGKVPEASMDRIEEDCLAKPSELGADVSPEFEAVLMKALSVRAVSRYQTVTELKEVLGSRITAKNTAEEEADVSLLTDEPDLAFSNGIEKPQDFLGKLQTIFKNKIAAVAVMASCVVFIGLAVLGFRNSKNRKTAGKAAGGTNTYETQRSEQPSETTQSQSGILPDVDSSIQSMDSTSKPEAVVSGSSVDSAATDTTAIGSIPNSREPKPAASGETPSPAPVLSDDCSLKSLTVSGYNLSPAFSSENTEYRLTVNADVTGISVNAAANQSSAAVKVSGPGVGSEQLSAVQINNVTVTVTASSGNSKKYTIHVTRKNEYNKDPALNNNDTSKTHVLLRVVGK